MLPKNSRHFIQPTAEELDCDPQLVDDAVWFFYAEVRRALVEMRGPNILVPNLGSFRAKYNELPKLIHKYEKHLAVLQPETFNQMATKKDLDSRLEKVKRLKQMILDEKARRDEFLKKKNERVKKDMGEQKSDS